jgi:hypothetical protein
MAVERDGSSATIRMIVEPLVPWIWAGGLVIVLGALITIWPARRRAAAVVPVSVPPLRPAGAVARPVVVADADAQGARP